MCSLASAVWVTYKNMMLCTGEFEEVMGIKFDYTLAIKPFQLLSDNLRGKYRVLRLDGQFTKTSRRTFQVTNV